MNLNPKKCKGILICPLRSKPDLLASLVNNRPLDVVSVHNVIGITLCNTMTWNVYFALVCSVLEYCCATWATSITAYLNDKIERAQKRALRILFPEKHYSDALSCANVTRLDVRRERLCLKVWHNIQAVPDSRLHHLLPPTRTISQPHNLRNTRKTSLPKCRTERFKKSFLPAISYRLSKR